MSKKAFVAPIFCRIKAFIIDIFFISMPILYITTYAILDGKNNFLHNQIAISLDWIIFGMITSAFYSINAQTPGSKSQNIYLINLSTGKKISFFHAFLRYILFIISGFSIVGLFICFFRKDKLNFHDIVSKTALVKPKSN